MALPPCFTGKGNASLVPKGKPLAVSIVLFLESARMDSPKATGATWTEAFSFRPQSMRQLFRRTPGASGTETYLSQ